MNASTAAIRPVTGSVTDQQRQALADDGFAPLPGVIPDDLLDDCQAVLETWVERTIAGWVAEGRLTASPAEDGFRRRLLAAWHAAGRPPYGRSPRGELVRLEPRRMFRVLSHPALVALAADLLGDDDLVAHGIWNSRPKAPDQRFTDTPWHQDAQYFPDEARLRMVNFWFPLHDVDAGSSCLAFAARRQQALFATDHDAEGTGFLGLTPADAATLIPRPVPLARGDAVAFGNLTPHRALANRTALMRWSFDVRFVLRADATPAALQHGFRVGRGDPDAAYAAWLASWGDAAW